jgi:asparagine synthase (glutamine-hydrolysing)
LFDGPLLEWIQPRNPYAYFEALYTQSDSQELMDQILTCDMYGYLPDGLLVKMDIASMANSLEARSPFLDHKLIEFAAKIPSKYKVGVLSGKWILKQALKDLLPEEILKRRKMGFGVPVSRWFRGELKDFVREILLSQKARQRGYFKIKTIEKLIQEHQTSTQDHGYKLWSLLMFELWHQAYMDKKF